MKRSIFLLLFIPFWLNAQLTENFTDGNFTSDPAWSGTVEKYIVNAEMQLQLNATEAGQAWLSTPYTAFSGTAEWRFWIKLAFSPSGSNYSDVYLLSDQADLSGTLNGYFLRFGEAGSNDAIELFLKQGSTITSVCRGTDALLATSFALDVKVVRKQNGDWNIFVDPNGSGIYNLDANGNNNTFSPGGYFGFTGNFTVSNSTKMYYDSVFIGEEVVDTQAPNLLSAAATDPLSITVTFDEAIAPEQLTQTGNYTINEGIGAPQQVTQGVTAAQAVLQLPAALQNGKLYTLTISGIKDIAGNEMPVVSVELSYYEAMRNDVVINEIMADPSPVVGLPEWEFVELYNPTEVLINLDNFVFLIGSTEKLISNVQIEPGGFLLLAHEDARASLEVFGSFYGFSSFQLANTTAALTLVSKQGIEISKLTYDDTWYKDTKKKEGGWSLEQIDPTNPCGGQNNWIASGDLSGGTPGRQNSYHSIGDAGPKPALMKLVSGNVIQIWFDQQMDALSFSNTDYYTLEPGNIHPQSAFTNNADPAFVELVFAQDFETGVLYKLNLDTQILNCAGRHVEQGIFIEFGIPQAVEKNDIVINEVLFNPFNDGVDFVELVNRSTKILNLEDLRLGDVRQTIPNPADTTLKVITATTKLMMPGDYVLLTTSAPAVAAFYEIPQDFNFVTMPSFPSYSNEYGTVILMSKDNKLIDVMTYNESMHYPLLNYVDGVSLERIAVDRPSDDLANWHSAAQSAGFATPGYRNSVQVDDNVVIDSPIVIDPETFSPDGDGYNDVTSVRYTFAEAGYTLNVHIYSASGQHVRHLVKSRLIADNGAVSWDGLDESGNKVPTGIYVVFAEVFAIDGAVKGYKKAVVVGTR